MDTRDERHEVGKPELATARVALASIALGNLADSYDAFDWAMRDGACPSCLLRAFARVVAEEWEKAPPPEPDWEGRERALLARAGR